MLFAGINHGVVALASETQKHRKVPLEPPVAVEPTGEVDVSTELVVVEAVELFEVAVEFAAVNSVDVLDVTLELEEVIKVVLTASSTAVVATLRS